MNLRIAVVTSLHWQIIISLIPAVCAADEATTTANDATANSTPPVDPEPPVLDHLFLDCGISNPTCGLGYFCSYNNFGKVDGSACEACPTGLQSEEEVADLCRSFLYPEAVQACLSRCTNLGVEGDYCDGAEKDGGTHKCQHESHFCNHAEGIKSPGVCASCPSNIRDCLSDDRIVSEWGLQSCLEACKPRCYPLHNSTISIEGGLLGQNWTQRAIIGSPLLTAEGPLVDCSNLIYEQETTCEGVNQSVCLVEDTNHISYYPGIVLKAQEIGCTAVLFHEPFHPEGHNDYIFWANLNWQTTDIPSLVISYNNAEYLKENKIGSTVDFTVDKMGDLCRLSQDCDHSLPCIGSNTNEYCTFEWFSGGRCKSCPVLKEYTNNEGKENGKFEPVLDENGDTIPDPSQCFLDLDFQSNQDAIQSCVNDCPGKISFDSCKFCTGEVGHFDFGVENEEDRFHFCQEQDVLHPEREINLFGKGTKCWQVQSLFQKVEIPKGSRICQLAQMLNYICGCKGPGYGGASTSIKKRILVWLPRVMAILSFLGSSFVIYDTTKTREMRQKTYHQMLATLSIFDLLGSAAYALTSLPIPACWTI